MRRKSLRLALLAVLTLLLASTGLGAQARRSPGDPASLRTASTPQRLQQAGYNDTYLVQLSDAPLASYAGGIDGLQPTSPALLGQAKLQPDSPASQAYLLYLDQQQETWLESAKQALARELDVRFRYKYAFNGLALRLSPQEATAVVALPGVRHLYPAQLYQLTTDAGPAWIGAPAVWSGGDMPGTQGEGIVAGIIDTGINHDHPSFADVGGDGYDHSNPRGQYYGDCTPVLCNDKLIGMWDFTGSSVFDDHGHGSHTASTVAGNFVTATLRAPTKEITANISGVAPHANIISYKVCNSASCVSPGIVAAIDQATADQVDVINFSIGGGSSDPWEDASAMAFLGAREAGVLVATSAGNSGPGPATVGSPADAPWIMSVGAATHDRAFVNSLTAMSGGLTSPPADIAGKSFTSGYGPKRIVHAADYGDGQCLNPFAPGTWSGEIVICDRGQIPRVDKGRNVNAGGAGGLVLANTEAEGEATVADPHELPAIHIGYTAAQKLAAWVRDGGSDHMATIAGTTIDRSSDTGDVTAGFSSRGPNPAVSDVLKPDVTAPGVDILAAVATTNPADPAEYGLMSGTSMSSPHSAGAAALLRSLHPEWSPAELQSALMLTSRSAGVRREDGVTPAVPFDRGAGRVDVAAASRAGLVLDETGGNYRDANPSVGGDPTTLNLASFADGSCTVRCSWTRVVSSTQDTAVTWTATTSATEGLDITVSPGSFELGPAMTQTIKVTVDVNNVELLAWAFGEIVLQPDSAQLPPLHFPMAVGMTRIVEIETGNDAGSELVSVLNDLAVSELTPRVYGLARAQQTQELLSQDPTPLQPYDSSVGTFSTTIDVAPGAKLLSAAIVDTTASDLDLFVGIDRDGDGPDASEEICRSAAAIALEACKIQWPAEGSYWVMVQNWLAGQGADSVQLEVSAIPGDDRDNFEVFGPQSVPAQTSFDVRLFWHECTMEPGDVWVGAVELASAPDRPIDIDAFLVRLTRGEDTPGGGCYRMPLLGN